MDGACHSRAGCHGESRETTGTWARVRPELLHRLTAVHRANCRQKTRSSQAEVASAAASAEDQAECVSLAAPHVGARHVRTRPRNPWMYPLMASGRSRENARAPSGPKISSRSPQTASRGTWLVRRYSCSFGYPSRPPVPRLRPQSPARPLGDPAVIIRFGPAPEAPGQGAQGLAPSWRASTHSPTTGREQKLLTPSMATGPWSPLGGGDDPALFAPKTAAALGHGGWCQEHRPAGG